MIRSIMRRMAAAAAVLLTIGTIQAVGASPATAATCGGGDAVVTGSQSSGFTTTYHGQTVYAGDLYIVAIWEAIGALDPNRTSQEKVSVMASGWIGDNAIDLPSRTAFEVCGTMGVGYRAGKGAVQAIGVTDVSVPHMNMTGNPYFGMRIADAHGLHLGDVDMNLDSGLGIRFERDLPGSTDVTMDDIYVEGASSHAVETWNIDGFSIARVTARDVGESGLLIQNSTNGWVGTVDGENVGTGTGYATFRMANNNGQEADGGYDTNIWVDNVISRGGGRGVFCVSQSGGVVIKNVDLANNGSNAILIENCYNVSIRGGTVNGGGEVRVAARSEFPNTRDVWVWLRVDNTSVRESPCGVNVNWSITGNASVNVC
ncbi:right-handed parallel beta-helix repeat-containing protein [Microbacterium karelineae]|uniref:right-handed parallel beta-helix repeat-containing protein n=1 Tax=Microbacterium karelineae TaxID=2654283 RepID=UPI0018D473C8|nr:right-handed parallel beta-helix repeat-containing protein [Microbacterium karelineae]